MISLYPHQAVMNNECRQIMLAGHKYILMQGATGIGKSRMAAAQIEAALQKGKISAFIVPKRDLVRQMSDVFTQGGLVHSFIVAGFPFNPFSKIYICTQGSLVRKTEKIRPNVIFIDEAHWGAGVLDKIIDYYKSIGSYVVLLSATPERLDGRGLDRYVDKMVCGPSIRWLIDNKYLSDYRLFNPSRPNLDGIKTVAGEYAKGQLNERMEADRVLIGNAVKHYRDHALGRLNVAFGTSIKHIEIIAQQFNDAGIPAASIDGTMSDAQRKQIIRAFARRELLVLTSVDLLHTGFDLSLNAGLPVTVECMSDLRPTKSLALQSQKWGRCLRYKEYPACIFDHAMNSFFADGTPNHGFPDDEREWTLQGRDRGSRTGERAVSVKQCPVCYFTHKPAPQCPNCGKIYEVQSRMVDEIDGELREIDRSAMVQTRKLEQGMARDLDQLIAVGRKRGMKHPHKWAAHVLSARNAK